MNTKTRNLIIGILLFVLAATAGLSFMYFAGREQGAGRFCLRFGYGQASKSKPIDIGSENIAQC